MNNTISEIKYTLEGINSRLDDAEDRISGLEDKEDKNIQSEQKEKKNMDNLRELWYNVKPNNTCFIGIPEQEHKEQVLENLFEKK